MKFKIVFVCPGRSVKCFGLFLTYISSPVFNFTLFKKKFQISYYKHLLFLHFHLPKFGISNEKILKQFVEKNPGILDFGGSIFKAFHRLFLKIIL